MIAVILISSAILCVALLVRTVYILVATPVLRTNGDLDVFPKVSILLPARNEASRILKHNIESLITQSYPELEIIVVDDQSTDATPTILRDFAAVDCRLRVVIGSEPPMDWVGKTFALHQAKETSNGDWLLAVDSDVVYSKEIVAASLAFAFRHKLDALSLLPRVTMLSFWESVAIP